MNMYAKGPYLARQLLEVFTLVMWISICTHRESDG
jgi:hypothetical protein